MYLRIYMHIHTCAHTVQRVLQCRRWVRWCQRNICASVTSTPANVLVPRSPIPKCMQHSLQKIAHIYIHTHICIRIHMHTNTHAHPRHRPHAEAPQLRPAIYAQICIFYFFLGFFWSFCECIFVSMCVRVWPLISCMAIRIRPTCVGQWWSIRSFQKKCRFSKNSDLKPQTTHELSVSWVVCSRIFCIGVVCRFRHGRWTCTWRRNKMNMIASDTGDEHGRCTSFATLYVASRGSRYGVATVSRIDKIIGLFCRISSLS